MSVSSFQVPANLNNLKITNGGVKYIPITGYLPLNATIATDAFNYTLNASNASISVVGGNMFKVQGLSNGSQSIAVQGKAATSRALNSSVTFGVTVEDAPSEPKSLVASFGGNNSSNGVLPLTVAAGGAITGLTFSSLPSTRLNPSGVVFDNTALAMIPALSVGYSMIQYDANTSAWEMAIGPNVGSEMITVGTIHNDDVNVTLNLNIVPAIMFKLLNGVSPLGALTVYLSGQAPILSTLNGNSDSVNVTTGIVSPGPSRIASPIGSGTVLQTISAAGMLSILSNTPAFTTIPLGAYTANVTFTSAEQPTSDILALVNADGSLVIKSNTDSLNPNTLYNVVLTSSANQNNQALFVIYIRQ